MHTLSTRSPVRSVARPILLERQLQRYRPPFQEAVRALANRHARLADLASSFPTLLFVLAVPRRGLDVAPAVALAVEGAPLAEVAVAADVPLWLRKFPPEAMTAPLAKLPDDHFFRRQIANHFPSRKARPTWLRAVSEVTDLAYDTFVVWIAKEVVRDRRAVKLDRLRLIGLWAWYSRQKETFAHSLIEKPWVPEMQFQAALDAAKEWLISVELHANLGPGHVDQWLSASPSRSYYFRSLTSSAEITKEAHAMKNCLRTYGAHVANNYSRLWSVTGRRDGHRVATLELGFRYGDPLPNIVQLKGPGNSKVAFEVWLAARLWLNGQDLSRFEAHKRSWNSKPLDRATWIELWRPYWLAKRRFPAWLPLAPSRDALEKLASGRRA